MAHNAELVRKPKCQECGCPLPIKPNPTLVPDKGQRCYIHTFVNVDVCGCPPDPTLPE